MRKTVMLFLSFFALVSVGMYFAPKNASAFPGFARKYNFPCTFCHISWPKLGDQGNFFHDRGFMLSTTGRGNGLDMMAFQPNNQNYWPIAWRTTVGYTGGFSNGVAGNSGTGSVSNGGYAGGGATANVDFLSGGLLNSYTSWWLVPTLAVGQPVNGGGSFELESAWVRFDNLFNTSWLNIKIGKSAIDQPFSTHRALQLVVPSPYVFDAYQPGTAYMAANFTGAGLSSLVPTAAYFDADQFAFATHHYAFSYFGYQFENGCGTTKGWSWDPCESRLSIAFMPNGDFYGQNTSFNGGAPDASSFTNTGQTGFAGTSNPTNYTNNGFSYFIHATQSFGGWGSTNGERIGAFALVGWEAPFPGAIGNSNPQNIFNREGIDLAANPIPNGGLNIFGTWEIAQDPSGLLVANPYILGTSTAAFTTATSGAEYMTWYIEADWMPTFGGLFKTAGAGSNMISLTYNQLVNLQQPVFAGQTVQLPGDWNNVLSFDLTDSYWLWASNRTDITLRFEYLFMINYGVGSSVNATSGNFTGMGGGGSALGTFAAGGGQFFDAESNNFLVAVDFAY